MIRRVDSGAPNSVPASDVETTTAGPETIAKSEQDLSSPQELEKSAFSGAASRAAEQAMTEKLLSSQLQAQIQSTGTPGVSGAEKPLLVEGSTGEDVKDIQKQVNEFRVRNGQEPIKEDGIFGPKTKAAIREFQETTGIKNDGIVGGNTRDRLTLENNENFQKLNPETQNQIRDMMNASQKDPATRRLLLTVATSEEFGKLPRAAQDAGLQNLGPTASTV